MLVGLRCRLAEPCGKDTERLAEAIGKRLPEQDNSVGKIKFVLTCVEAMDEGFESGTLCGILLAWCFPMEGFIAQQPQGQ